MAEAQRAVITQPRATPWETEHPRFRALKGRHNESDFCMPQSIGNLYVHLVFSTKNRVPLLGDEVREELHRYMAVTLQNWQCSPILINSLYDHVHILFLLSKNHGLAKIVEEVKKTSSKWIKGKGTDYQDFGWQNGYGGFSVSKSKVDAVETYIRNQAEHHRYRSFQEEYLEFLDKHEVEYDLRYVFD